MKPALLMATDPVAGEALIKRGERIWLISVDRGWKRRPMDDLRDVIRWTRTVDPKRVDKEFPDFDSAVEAVRKEFQSRHPLTDAEIRETLAHCPSDIRLHLERRSQLKEPVVAVKTSRNVARNELIALFVHEFSSHLMPIAFLAEMMKRDPKGSPSAPQVRGLELLPIHVGRLLRLIEDFRFLATLKNRRTRPQELDLPGWLAQRIQSLATAAGHAVRLAKASEPRTSPVFADPEILDGALRALLTSVSGLSKSQAPIELAIRSRARHLELTLFNPQEPDLPVESVFTPPLFSPEPASPMGAMPIGDARKDLESHLGRIEARRGGITLKIPFKR